MRSPHVELTVAGLREDAVAGPLLFLDVMLGDVAVRYRTPTKKAGSFRLPAFRLSFGGEDFG
jgi:hypothetical protein